MSKAIKDTDYLYITAYLRAREASLLSAERISRMLDAKTNEDAAKVLEECGYGDVVGIDAAALEKKLSERRDSVMQDLARLSPSKEIVDVFRVKYDYHNAKVLIKAEAAGTDGAPLLSEAGRVLPERMADAFLRDELKGLPTMLGDAVREAKDVLARTDDPRLADFVLDKAYYKEFIRLAEESGSDFLVTYGKLSVDSANLRTAVRAARMSKDGAFLKNVIAEGGSVSRERLVSALSSGTQLAGLYAGTPLYQAAQAGDEAVEGGRLTGFEKLCDDALSSYLASAKLTSFSEKSVIAYICAVETEISTVRIIMTGRMAGLAPEVIRERLRDPYV